MANPRILMVCYYFPPIITSGVARNLSFAKELEALGWKPTVLTVKHSHDPWVKQDGGGSAPENLEIVRCREFPLMSVINFFQGILSHCFAFFGKDLKKNYLREFVCIPDNQIGWCFWISLLLGAFSSEYVYVSSSPFSAAVWCALLKPVYRKPLIVDFRDIWAINPKSKEMKFRQSINRLLERLVIRRADKLILNTHGSKNLYADAYPKHASALYVLPNGYDELLPAIPRAKNSKEPFTIMHVGSFYGTRNPQALIQALGSLAVPGIRFVQIGGSCTVLESVSNGVTIEMLDARPRAEVLEMMRSADVLYLNQGDDDTTAIAAKTFEYLATGLPILAECPEGDNAQLLRKYGTQAHIVAKGDVAAMQNALAKLYQNRAQIKPSIDEQYIKVFDRKSLAQTLTEIIEGKIRAEDQRFYD